MTSSPFDPLRSSLSPVIVYIDIKSPYAFIAVHGTRRLEQACGVPFDWRPLTLDIPSYLGSARLDKVGKVASADRSPQQWSAVKYAYRDARRYAALQGHGLRGTEKIWDTSLVHIAMNWVKANAPEALPRFLDQCYPPFWQRALDVESEAVVHRLLAASKVPTEGFSGYLAAHGRAAHDAEQAAIFAAGIYGVPAYVHEQHWWFGRENLPILEHRLRRLPGPVPDIAYRIDPDAQVEPAQQLDIYLDLTEAQSYLGLTPTLDLLARTRRRARFLPFAAKPPSRRPANPPPPADADRGTRHRQQRSRFRVNALEAQATARGLNIERRYQHATGKPDPALTFNHLLLWFAEHNSSARLEPFLQRAFSAWWEEGADLTDAERLASLLNAAGQPAEPWLAAWREAQHGAPGSLADQLASALQAAQVAGVFEGPGYVLDAEPFCGRAHLPLVEARWRR